MTDIDFIKKAIERNKYVLSKIEKGEFQFLPKEYRNIKKDNLISFYKSEIKYWEEELGKRMGAGEGEDQKKSL